MPALYIDVEPYVCAWTENLMDAGLIPEGEIWCRSIKDIQTSELRRFTTVHAFNGMSGWAYALRRAGWPDDRPVWTGSAPCTPFSVAGKQEGFEDPRHLWPDFARLIRECEPPTVFGEQVSSASAWLNLVRSDLEAMGYAVGAVPVQAASAGADHFRDRYFFVANNDSERSGEERLQRSRELSRTGGDKRDRRSSLAHGQHPERGPFSSAGGDELERSEEREEKTGRFKPRGENGGSSSLANSNLVGPQEPLSIAGDPGSECSTPEGNSVRGVEYDKSVGWGEGWTESEFRSRGFTASVASIESSQYIECPDGKWRRLPPPSVRWLATRLRARIPQLRAIGNSIDIRPATAFIKAFLESEHA